MGKGLNKNRKISNDRVKKPRVIGTVEANPSTEMYKIVEELR